MVSWEFGFPTTHKIDALKQSPLNYKRLMTEVHPPVLKVSTITLVLPFQGMVFIPTIFDLLPVTTVVVKPTTNNQKPKTPVHAMAGTCVSVRYDGKYRGLWGNTFRNCIMIDMSIAGKNLNVKLNKNLLHICGCTEDSQATNAAGFLIAYLARIQDGLDRLRADPRRLERLQVWYTVHRVI